MFWDILNWRGYEISFKMDSHAVLFIARSNGHSRMLLFWSRNCHSRSIVLIAEEWSFPFYCFDRGRMVIHILFYRRISNGHSHSIALIVRHKRNVELVSTCCGAFFRRAIKTVDCEEHTTWESTCNLQSWTLIPLNFNGISYR